MTDEDLMTGAELLTVSEGLGLNRRDLASVLGVAERTVSRWLDEQVPIPDGVRLQVEGIEAMTAENVGRVVAALQDARDVGVYVYRRSEDMWAERPDLAPYPARWWRVVAYRAACEVPGVEIRYAEAG